MGLAGSAQAVVPLSERTGVGVAGSYGAGLGAASDGWRMGPTAGAAAGIRFRPQSWSPVLLTGYGVFTWHGRDARETLVYEQTGLTAAGVDLGVSWRFWVHQAHSAAVQVHAQAPLWQGVGDPWLAQNYAISTGLQFAL